MPRPLDGARLKYERGCEHVDTLHSEVVTFLEENAGRVLEQYDSEAGRYVRQIIDTLPTPDAWSALIGDIAHNFRSCLDHIAWQMSLVGNPLNPKGEPWRKRDITFPTYVSRHEYLSKRHTAWRHQGLRAPDRWLLRKSQPYQRGNAAEAHPFWHLSELSNIDKHQVIHTTVVGLGEAMPKPGSFVRTTVDPTTQEPTITYGPLEPSAIPPGGEVEVDVVFRINGPSHADVYLKGDLPFQVEIDQPGTVLHEQPVLGLVDAIRLLRRQSPASVRVAFLSFGDSRGLTAMR